MDIYTFKSDHPYGANTYVISDSGEYAIIDPAASVKKILTSLDATIKDFRYIILTHAHFDHILCIDEWQQKTGIPVTVSSLDAPMLRDSHLNCYEFFFGEKRGYFGDISLVNDGDTLPLGKTFLKIHPAPGHTPGSILIEEGKSLFVGDTVFAGQAYGRCDLPGGDFEKLRVSIEKIHLFPPDTEVYPGHGEKTKISKVIRF